jgi:hypothetical protein
MKLAFGQVIALVLQVGSIENYEFAASNQRAVNGGVGTLKTFCFFSCLGKTMRGCRNFQTKLAYVQTKHHPSGQLGFPDKHMKGNRFTVR